MRALLFFVLVWMAIPSLSAQEPVDTIPDAPRFFETNPEAVYKIVEEMPRFPGCEDLKTRQQKDDCAMRKMLEFIIHNLKYPPEARQNGVGGTAIIRFVVERDGTLTHFEIARDPGAGCGEEALRVAQLMPPFVPGTQHGKPVRVEYNLPVKFSVN